MAFRLKSKQLRSDSLRNFTFGSAEDPKTPQQGISGNVSDNIFDGERENSFSAFIEKEFQNCVNSFQVKAKRNKELMKVSKDDKKWLKILKFGGMDQMGTLKKIEHHFENVFKIKEYPIQAFLKEFVKYLNGSVNYMCQQHFVNVDSFLKDFSEADEILIDAIIKHYCSILKGLNKYQFPIRKMRILIKKYLYDSCGNKMLRLLRIHHCTENIHKKMLIAREVFLLDRLPFSDDKCALLGVPIPYEKAIKRLGDISKSYHPDDMVIVFEEVVDLIFREIDKHFLLLVIKDIDLSLIICYCLLNADIYKISARMEYCRLFMGTGQRFELVRLFTECMNWMIESIDIYNGTTNKPIIQKKIVSNKPQKIEKDDNDEKEKKINEKKIPSRRSSRSNNEKQEVQLKFGQVTEKDIQKSIREDKKRVEHLNLIKKYDRGRLKRVGSSILSMFRKKKKNEPKRPSKRPKRRTKKQPKKPNNRRRKVSTPERKKIITKPQPKQQPQQQQQQTPIRKKKEKVVLEKPKPKPPPEPLDEFVSWGDDPISEEDSTPSSSSSTTQENSKKGREVDSFKNMDGLVGGSNVIGSSDNNNTEKKTSSEDNILEGLDLSEYGLSDSIISSSKKKKIIDMEGSQKKKIVIDMDEPNKRIIDMDVEGSDKKKIDMDMDGTDNTDIVDKVDISETKGKEEDIDSLKNELKLKDLKITSLEEEVQNLKKKYTEIKSKLTKMTKLARAQQGQLKKYQRGSKSIT